MVSVLWIPIIYSLYHHGFASSIMLLNCTKHNLICLAVLLIITLRGGRIARVNLVLMLELDLLVLLVLQLGMLLLMLLMKLSRGAELWLDL